MHPCPGRLFPNALKLCTLSERADAPSTSFRACRPRRLPHAHPMSDLPHASRQKKVRLSVQANKFRELQAGRNGRRPGQPECGRGRTGDGVQGRDAAKETAWRQTCDSGSAGPVFGISAWVAWSAGAIGTVPFGTATGTAAEPACGAEEATRTMPTPLARSSSSRSRRAIVALAL